MQVVCAEEGDEVSEFHVGDIVDYHSVIGGPVTLPKTKISDGPFSIPSVPGQIMWMIPGISGVVSERALSLVKSAGAKNQKSQGRLGELAAVAEHKPTEETSLEAYDDQKATGKLGEKQMAVLKVLRNSSKPLSSREIAAELRGEIDNLRSISPRMKELMRKGLAIRLDEKHVCSLSKMRVFVYQAAPDGTPPQIIPKRLPRHQLFAIMEEARSVIEVLRPNTNHEVLEKINDATEIEEFYQ